MSDDKKKASNELLPPEGDPEVGKRVFEILHEVIEDKNAQGLPEKYCRHHELVRNKHFKSTVEVPTVSVNLCHVHVQRTCNMLTDNDPTFEVTQLIDADDGAPANDQEDQAFELLQKAASFWWVDQEQQDIFDSNVRNGETYGIAIAKVIFNTEECPLGEVETCIVDPFHFGWYPTKAIRNPRDIQKAAAVLHFYPMAVRDLKRKYPDHADEIKPDSDIIEELKDERRDFEGTSSKKAPKNIITTLAGIARNLFNWKSAQEINEEEALVCEIWCKDYTSATEDKKNAKDEKEKDEPGKVKYTKSKYRGNIRKVVAINGDLVLEDVSNPNVNDDLDDKKAQMTYLFDKYPFTAANSIKDSVNAWGSSDLEQLEWLNFETNKSLSQLILEKDTAIRKKIVNPLTSGVDNDAFTNYVSVINPVNAEEANAIHWLTVPQGDSDIVASVTLFKDLYFLVAGTFEADQKSSGGNNAGDVIAYKALAIIQERNQTMMRGKTRSYGRLCRDIGRMFISMAQNFYTEERYISYEDENGIKVAKKIKGSDLIIPCRLTVVSGSTLPTSNVQKREEAMHLYEKGVVDRPYTLKELGVNGRKEIIERMNAGPVGQVMTNLGAMGVPQPLLQLFGQVAVMEPKEIAKAIEDGQLPPFQVFIQQMARAMAGMPDPEQQTPPAEQAEVEVKKAEAAAKNAQAQKTGAEIGLVAKEAELVSAKIESEKVGQRVALAGVHFDNKKLAMEEARTVNDITMARKAATPVNMPGAKEAAETILKDKGKPPEKPAGELKPQAGPTPRPPLVDITPAVVPEEEDTVPPPPTPDSKALPAGYNEAGLVSNNEKEGNLDAEMQPMGARADGGPVTAGKPYLVGEKGPEVIVPSQNGTVVPNKEAQFQEWIRGTQWFGEYKEKYGEEPDLNTDKYDYRSAFDAGITPTVRNKKDGMLHWPSSTGEGKPLKSKDHPTYWMEGFMRKTGIDPESIGINTEADGLAYILKNGKKE
jgi:hypothetical protein